MSVEAIAKSSQNIYHSLDETTDDVFWESCCSNTDTDNSDGWETGSEVEEPLGPNTIRQKPEVKKTGCAKRKGNNPMKSALRFDPRFRGVCLHFKTTFNGEATKLTIKPYYSCSRRTKQCRFHKHELDCEKYADWASSSESDDNTTSCGKSALRHGNKQCASCQTRKTPLWRDAEDGTPLCNACGIRYKKYRTRCGYCWHVPRKASKSYPVCTKCGEKYQHSSLRRYSPVLCRSQ